MGEGKREGSEGGDFHRSARGGVGVDSSEEGEGEGGEKG